MKTKRLLIANRAEVAQRVAASARDLGWHTIGMRAEDETPERGLASHLRHVDSALVLSGRGVAAYLDIDAILEVAREARADAIHPGWGFLAENAEFAGRAIEAGLVWIGPDPEQLSLFGNKLEARALAERCRVPVLAASDALAGAAELHAYWRAVGTERSLLLKAAAGGGGRGMRLVGPGDDPTAALASAREEAKRAFGNSRVYAEAFLARARHVEVQIAGDGSGTVQHLWERDCSLQRRHQKLVEMAPAPGLDPGLRQVLLEDSMRLASAARYRGLGTFEFLIDRERGTHYFIEANPRLQVEHTVTEAVLSLDLVALQLALAEGATLRELSLADAPPAPRGLAVQLRVNAERLGSDGEVVPEGGRLEDLELPAGVGVRCDCTVRRGDVVNPAFDTLLAKIVVHEPSGQLGRALDRAARALGDTRVSGVDVNVPVLQALVARPEVRNGTLHTRLVDDLREALVDEAKASAGRAQDLTDLTRPGAEAAAAAHAPPGTEALAAPMPASVVEIKVAEGDRVDAGAELVVLEAMKMHHALAAGRGGVIARVAVQLGDVVREGDPLLFVLPGESSEATRTEPVIDPEAPRADLEEVRARHALGLDASRPEAVARRRRVGGRTARENVEALCDPDSFIEYGALAIAAQRRRRSVEDLMAHTPSDGMIAGFGTVNGDWTGGEQARCAVLAYDYTVLAGTQGHVNHKKKDRMFELAERWSLPVVFFTEGGGGRPGDVDTDDLIMSWLDISTFTTWPRIGGLAPRIAVNFGRCFAGNAVIFGCADITVATESSNIGLAGPAMTQGGGLGRFTPEDIGPIDVQTRNGVVDVACADEREATVIARQLLGYFQGVRPDWVAADQRLLRQVVPENRLRVYDVREAVRILADQGSVTELRRAYGVGVITAFVRIEGRPFGLIANDPRHLGGAIDGEGGEKGARFLQLCDAYGLPVVSLCDTPGFMVGPESEKTAAVRRGSRLIVASANLTVPLFCVVLRKGYGLGAQAMAGGGLHEPFFTVGWPTSEFGPMGLEGAVELGFRKELDAASSEGGETARRALFERLVGQMYDKGKGVSVAQAFEVDAVIDPAETRQWLLRGLRSCGPIQRGVRRYPDVW